MKRLLAILFSFAFTSLVAYANLFPQTNETRVTHEYASYDTGGKSPYMFRYMKTFADAMYPAYTNHWMPVSRSGASISGIRNDATSATQARRSIPFWSWNTNIPVFNIEAVSENGGGTSNQMYTWCTNLFSAPPIFFNFVADTNEAVPSSTVVPLLFSGINDNPADPNRNLDISRAATNVSIWAGTPVLDLWSVTWTNGLINDVIHNYFGFWADASGHMYAPGGLAMCLWGYILLGGETNIGSATLDWNTASVVASDHMTASGISRSGNTLSWTHFCSRMPGGWDEADGTITNTADNCFLLYPMLPNMFQWTLAFNNLNPAHSYTLSIDASNVVTMTGAQWGVGWNMFTNYNGSYWAQRKQLLFDTTDWYGLDHVTLQEVGSTGPLGPNLLAYESNAGIYPGVTGTNFIHVMTATYGWPANEYVYDTKNHNDAQQTNHLMTLTDVTLTPRLAPFHK